MKQQIYLKSSLYHQAKAGKGRSREKSACNSIFRNTKTLTASQLLLNGILQYVDGKGLTDETGHATLTDIKSSS
jgi:hypothetical protein